VTAAHLWVLRYRKASVEATSPGRREHARLRREHWSRGCSPRRRRVRRFPRRSADLLAASSDVGSVAGEAGTMSRGDAIVEDDGPLVDRLDCDPTDVADTRCVEQPQSCSRPLRSGAAVEGRGRGRPKSQYPLQRKGRCCPAANEPGADDTAEDACAPARRTRMASASDRSCSARSPPRRRPSV
jgi:hypothetical protein